ncbi:replication initiation protein [Persicobacter diffluens]
MKLDQYRLVVKSNELVNSRQHFTATQQRIVLAAVARVNDDSDVLQYKIPITEILGENYKAGGKAYSLVKDAVRGLMNSSVEMEQQNLHGKLVWEAVGFISYTSIVEGEGSFLIRFDPEMKRFLLNLKGNFTKYFIHNVAKFRKAYSIRIYELCKQYFPRIKERKFEIGYFKFLLGLEGKYKYISQLVDRVILPSIDEINLNSDLSIDFKLLPENRRSKKEIVFVISGTNKSIAENEETTTISLDKNPITSKNEYIDQYVAEMEGVRNPTAYKSKLMKDDKFDQQYQDYLQEQEQKLIKVERLKEAQVSKQNEEKLAKEREEKRALHFEWSKSLCIAYYNKYDYKKYREEVVDFLRENYTTILNRIMEEFVFGELSVDTQMRIGKFLLLKLGSPEEIELFNNQAKWEQFKEFELNQEQQAKELEKQKLEEEIRKMTERLNSL